MRVLLSFTVMTALLILTVGCVQVNLPEVVGKKTAQFTLVMPKEFKKMESPVIVSEFVSESPAKFKMLSRKGTALKTDSHSKWVLPPAVMVSSAYRKLYGAENLDHDTAKYMLEGDLFTFERNMDTKTADLKIQYTLIDRSNEKVVFRKLIQSSIPLGGNSPENFADAMSKAVAEQAEQIRQEIVKLEKKK